MGKTENEFFTEQPFLYVPCNYVLVLFSKKKSTIKILKGKIKHILKIYTGCRMACLEGKGRLGQK